MSVSFNWNTVLSSFDERGTLLKQLKSMEDAFTAAGMTDCEVVDPTDTSLKLKFTFADGSNLTTSAINIKGAKGDAATVAVGTTSTLAAGSSATVTNSGSSSAAVLNFGIPKGDKGDTGEAGGITNINSYTGAVTTSNGISFVTGTLSSYDFNLTDSGTIALNEIAASDLTGISSMSGSISYALNADKSIGKIYNQATLVMAMTSAGHARAKLGITVAAPDTAYYIQTGSMIYNTTTNTIVSRTQQFYIDTAGDVYLDVYTSATSDTWFMLLPACVYFFKDFGDTPNRELARSVSNMSSERILNVESVEER